MFIPRRSAAAAALVFGMSLSACSGGGTSTPPTMMLASNTSGSAGQTVASAVLPESVQTQTVHAMATAQSAGEQARSSDDFVDSIGMNTHLNWGNYQSNYSGVRSALVGLGVRHIRESYSLRPNTGVLDRFRDLAGAGIHTVMTANESDSPTAMVAYLHNYIPSIEAFEGPNEPNGTTPDWAPRLQAFTKSLYQAVKGNSASAKYPVFGSALDSNLDGSGDFAKLGDLSAYMDKGNLHDYQGGYMPRDTSIASQLALERLVSGTRPIIATEDGFCTANTSQGVSLQTQMTYTTRMFIKQYADGFNLTMGHLLDENTNPNDFWGQCGIMTYNFAPKPAFTALKNMIGLLNDPGTSVPKTKLNYWFSNGSTLSIAHQLLQKNDGTFYLAVWLDASDYDPITRSVLHPPAEPITVNFSSAPSAITEYDFDTSGNLNAKSVAQNGGAAQIVLTDSVKFLKIAGSGLGTPTPAPSASPSGSAPTVANTAAHWSFDEDAGTNAADSVSPASAKLYGNSSWESGVHGASVAVPSGSYLSAPGGLIDTSQSYSVAAWLNLSDTSTERTAVAIEGNQHSAFHLGLTADRGFGFEVYPQDAASGLTSLRASQALPPATGNWYHVVGVYDRPNCQISLYVNASLVKTVAGCTTFKAGGATDFGRAMRGAGTYPNPWSGAIDEVNLYQRALSQADISTLAQR